MKRFTSAAAFFPLLLSAGCSSPPETAESRDVLREALVFGTPFDYRKFRLGEWAIYRVVEEKSRQTSLVKISVTEEDAAGRWIEFRVPAPPEGTMIVKEKFDKDGDLIDLYMGPPGGGPSTVRPSLRRDAHEAKSGLEPQVTILEGDETVSAGGRRVPCRRVTITISGHSRTTEVVNWCSDEFPFPIRAGMREYGGLARRSISGQGTMELVECGRSGARPELPLPR
jgi:hypothetical protein